MRIWIWSVVVGVRVLVDGGVVRVMYREVGVLVIWGFDMEERERVNVGI